MGAGVGGRTAHPLLRCLRVARMRRVAADAAPSRKQMDARGMSCRNHSTCRSVVCAAPGESFRMARHQGVARGEASWLRAVRLGDPAAVHISPDERTMAESARTNGL